MCCSCSWQLVVVLAQVREAPGMSLRINIVECYRLYYWNSYYYVSAMAKAKAMQNSTF